MLICLFLSLIPGLRSKSLEGLCHEVKSRQIVEEFLRHAMRKTETRNMMDDVVSIAAANINNNKKNASNSNNNFLTSAVYSKLVTSRNAVTTINRSAQSLGNNLHLLSSEVLAEIAPLAFQSFGFCSTLSFHNVYDHSNQVYLAVVVPAFPTCVFIIDIAIGKIISILQQENVITTLTWKPPREMLEYYHLHNHSNNNNNNTTTVLATRSGNYKKSQNQHQQPIQDPVLVFTTDSHNGCLYLWTHESALCVAMPEIAKVAAHKYNNTATSTLKEKNLNSGMKSSSNSLFDSANCEKHLHIACEDPDCRRNWLYKQQEIEKRRAFERGEVGGFRPSFAAWTDAGNTLLLIDTIRGSHTVASLL